MKTHTVPKGVEQIEPEVTPPSPSPTPPAAAPDAPTDAAVAWTVPAGWKVKPGEVPMRFATFVIEDEEGPIEVIVSRFPGDVGGVLANVNRWRGQVGLGAATEADLPAMLRPFDHGRFAGYTLHLESPTRHLLAASIHDADAGETWFVKVITSPAAAGRIADSVAAFAHSFGQAPESGG